MGTIKLRDYQLISPTATKAVSLEQFNNDALWVESAYESALRPRNKQSDMMRSTKYRDTIGVLYRCIDVRSSSIASLPFTILKGDEVFIDSETAWDNPEYNWVNDISSLLYLTEASLLLSSEAFWFKNYAMTRKLLNLQWLAAPYINPVYDASKGITGFRRNLGQGDDTFTPEQIVYFWIQNPMGELTPDIPQTLAAAISADVVLNYEDFVKKFYERGAVKATILKVDRSTPPAERKRLREFWQNFMSGVKSAYNTEVVSGDVESEVIGEGAGDSEKTEILTSRRKDIATTMGVPYSLLFGDTSSSYTAGPTEEKNFLNYSVVPRARLIQGFLNKQLFAEYGLQFRFNFGALPAFKEAGDLISKIFTTYVDALMPHSVAARIAGVTLPEGITYDDLDKFAEQERERQFKEKERIVTLNSKLTPGADGGKPAAGGDKPKPKAKPNGEDNNLKTEDAKVEEVRRFSKWLKNRGPDVDIDDFESELLDEEEKLLVYKVFVDKRGGGTAQAPFSLSSKPALKSMQVYGDTEGEEPEGLDDLDDENAGVIEAGLLGSFGYLLNADANVDDAELLANFEMMMYGDSAELKSGIYAALLAYADFGVEVAVRKVSQFYPGFDAEESRYAARDWAQTRALEVYNLVMAASLRKARQTIEEYKRGGMTREWLKDELRKAASAERAMLIAENESIAVITQAAYIVYANTKLVQYVKWVTMRDERVCPRCGPLHGKVYPLGGSPAIPVHVRCRCQILPMVDGRILRLLAGLL